MIGMAQKHMNDAQDNAAGVAVSYASAVRWPLLYRWAVPIDYAVADFLLKGNPEASEEAAFFIAHLSLASRQGHLCIEMTDGAVLPDPQKLWLQEAEGAACPVFNSLIQKGAAEIPGQLYGPSGSLRKDGSRYYFQRCWVKESQLLDSFQGLMHEKVQIPVCEAQVFQLLEGIPLLEEQRQAVLQASKNTLTIICGGPGTGKTYTAGQLVRIIWSALDIQDRQNFQIALAAPTGKAAANLQKSLGRVLDNLEGLTPPQAKTLHALLGLRTAKSTPLPIFADLVIIDESSMIDLDLMQGLLAGIKPGARLILLGDPYQLPSVESGGVFHDFVEFLQFAGISGRNGIKPVELKTCVRTDLRQLVELAQHIKSGNFEEAARMQGIFRPLDQAELVQDASRFFLAAEGEDPNPRELMDSFNRYRLLSPLRKGPFGVETLNELMKNSLQKKYRKHPYFAAPIMLAKNDAELGVFNGEVGVLIRFNRGFEDGDSAFKEGDYAVFPGETADELRKIPAVLLPSFEYAYCLSVHKSQGSEFDHVVLALPDGSESFGREVLYTAVTRARKKLEIRGTDATFQQTLAKHSRRLSGIVPRLIQGLIQ